MASSSAERKAGYLSDPSDLRHNDRLAGKKSELVAGRRLENERRSSEGERGQRKKEGQEGTTHGVAGLGLADADTCCRSACVTGQKPIWSESG